MALPRLAPALDVSAWLNSEPLTLDALRGRVVVIDAFQMLCPGCVANGLPQAARVQSTFASTDVQVIGLHTVFEHHEAQGSEAALKAFLHEYRIGFPVAIDRQTGRGLPATMAAYAMQGTPTLVLIDPAGRVRRKVFGHVPDLQLGAEIVTLLSERPAAVGAADAQQGACGPDGCLVPTAA